MSPELRVNLTTLNHNLWLNPVNHNFFRKTALAHIPAAIYLFIYSRKEGELSNGLKIKKMITFEIENPIYKT